MEDKDELDLTGDEWMTSLCQEGHDLCYEIRHKGDVLHFQPASIEWNQAKLIEMAGHVPSPITDGMITLCRTCQEKLRKLPDGSWEHFGMDTPFETMEY